MKRILIVCGLFVALMAGGSVPSQAGQAHAATTAVHAVGAHTALFDKTRFVVDLGVAYFCIHHVYKTYRRGLYNRGARDRLRHIVVAGAVLALAYNRLHAAYTDASSSDSRTLRRLVSPLRALLGKIQGQKNDLVGGTFNPSSFRSMNGAADSFGGTTTHNGVFFHDISVPLPSGA